MKKAVLISLLLGFFATGLFAQKNKVMRKHINNQLIVYAIASSVNGHALAVADGEEVLVYNSINFETLNLFSQGHSQTILSLAISRDSLWLASGDRGGALVLWRFDNGTIVESLQLGSGAITDIQFSSDNKHLILATAGGKAFLYGLKPFALLAELADASSDLLAVDFCPNNNCFATAGADKTIRLYDFKTQKLINELHGHNNWIRSLSFDEEGKRLYSAGDDGKVRLWHIGSIASAYLDDEIRIKGKRLSSVDACGKGRCFAVVSIQGRVVVSHLMGIYDYDVGRAVHQVLLLPLVNDEIRVALATNGFGLVVISAADMNYWQYYTGNKPL
jgi:WD40 repeat protein